MLLPSLELSATRATITSCFSSHHLSKRRVCPREQHITPPSFAPKRKSPACTTSRKRRKQPKNRPSLPPQWEPRSQNLRVCSACKAHGVKCPGSHRAYSRTCPYYLCACAKCTARHIHAAAKKATLKPKRCTCGAMSGPVEIGTRIVKLFDGEGFQGEVVSASKTGWNVKYEDGEFEDLDEDEIKSLMIANKCAGDMSTLRRVWKVGYGQDINFFCEKCSRGTNKKHQLCHQPCSSNKDAPMMMFIPSTVQIRLDPDNDEPRTPISVGSIVAAVFVDNDGNVAVEIGHCTAIRDSVHKQPVKHCMPGQEDVEIKCQWFKHQWCCPDGVVLSAIPDDSHKFYNCMSFLGVAVEAGLALDTAICGGWWIEFRQRKDVKNRSSKHVDKYYHTPCNKTLRSIREVESFLMA